MDWNRITPGVSFMVLGFAILGVAAALEAEIVLSVDYGQGYLSGDLTRLSMVPWALGFIFIGYAMDHPAVLWDRARGRRVLATYLLFTDGGIHLLAIGEHIDLSAVVFFIFLTPIELVGAWYMLNGSPGYLKAWLIGAVGLIALYVTSRLTMIPFVSQQYRVEALGILAKSIEILLIAVLAKELWVLASEERRVASRRTVTQS